MCTTQLLSISDSLLKLWLLDKNLENFTLFYVGHSLNILGHLVKESLLWLAIAGGNSSYLPALLSLKLKISLNNMFQSNKITGRLEHTGHTELIIRQRSSPQVNTRCSNNWMVVCKKWKNEP